MVISVFNYLILSMRIKKHIFLSLLILIAMFIFGGIFVGDILAEDSPELPDLFITNINFSPANPVAGKPFSGNLNVEIINQGDVPTQHEDGVRINLSFYYHDGSTKLIPWNCGVCDPSSKQEIQKHINLEYNLNVLYTENLNVSEKRVLSYPIDNFIFDVDSIIVTTWIDTIVADEGPIAESDEFNNGRSIQINIADDITNNISAMESAEFESDGRAIKLYFDKKIINNDPEKPKTLKERFVVYNKAGTAYEQQGYVINAIEKTDSEGNYYVLLELAYAATINNVYIIQFNDNFDGTPAIIEVKAENIIIDDIEKVLLPDIEPVSIHAEKDSFFVTICNNGNSNIPEPAFVPSIIVRTSNISYPATGFAYMSSDQAPVKPGSCGIVRYSYNQFNLQASETYEVKVTIDPSDEIIESNEKNNIKILNLKVGESSEYQPPSITVLSPNGGELWKVGNTQRIEWDAKIYPSSAQVVIGLDVTEFKVVEIGRTFNSGNFDYKVPEIAGGEQLGGGHYKVLVSVYNDETLKYDSDRSDSKFTILADGFDEIPVQEPNGKDITKNESEITKLRERIKKLEYKISKLENSLIEAERRLTTLIDKKLTRNLKGRILLQVEENGEAWYVDEVTEQKFYLKDGNTAYQALKAFGLGVANADLAKIPVGIEDRFEDTDTDNDGLSDKIEEALGTDPNNTDTDGDGFSDGEEVRGSFNPHGLGRSANDVSLANRLKGKIILQVESRGEAWYIHPENGKRYYMKDGPAAYQIMRFLSLGITNDDLRKIDVGSFGEE